MASPEIPQKIGRYRVIRKLRQGGMGVVYLAQDPFIDRMVAIKTTLSFPSNDPERLEQFQQTFFKEAKIIGKLMHPYIVSVHDASVENGRCYLVMEYVDGSTLEKYCRKTNLLPLEKILKIAFQCAMALDYAHQNGVIHRDVKPGNIMISTKGDVKICDFGIATVEEALGLSQRDGLVGTLCYLSPEQLRGEQVTPQSDLFSFGVVMYELLTGTKPFQADTDISTLFRIANEAPEPLKRHRHDFPESLERIVMQALEKNLARRYRTGLQLASELSASFDHLRFLDQEINFQEKFSSLKKIKFFKDFTSSELAEVLKASQWVKYEDTLTIITEGETEDCFYIIIVGEVMVRKEGKTLATLKKGDCFGEMAYLGKTMRTATIEALGNTILMKVSASIIDRTSINTQLRFHKAFSNILTQRLASTSEMLSKVSLDNS